MNETYILPRDLLQAVVSTLNELPAGRVRPLLNAIEQECLKQDQQRVEQAKAAERAAIRAELLAEGTELTEEARP